MQLKFFAPLIALASAVAASTVPEKRIVCAEAARFGVLNVSPTTLASGDTLTVNASFPCAAYFGIFPKYIDYYVEAVSGGNGHQAPILLARHEWQGTSDVFSVQLPYGFYLTGANYAVILDNTYAINGTNGSPVYVTGGTESPITITTTSS